MKVVEKIVRPDEETVMAYKIRVHSQASPVITINRKEMMDIVGEFAELLERRDVLIVSYGPMAKDAYDSLEEWQGP